MPKGKDISVEDVPSIRRQESVWEDTFKSIKEGKGKVFDEEDVKVGALRAALAAFKERKEYTYLKVSQRKDKIYLFYPKAEVSE